MTIPVNDDALDRIWRQARTHNGWQDKAVSETLMRAVYDLAKMGPTSANCCPARFVFISSAEAKERLRPYLDKGNVDKTMAAPWTVIIANDLEFAEKMPELFPHNPSAKDWFADDKVRNETAMRNGTLQGAYLMLAARALGLDCGPMSGFDAGGVDEAFFLSSPSMRSWRSNWLCNIGYGDPSKLYPRGPRLSFDDACSLL